MFVGLELNEALSLLKDKQVEIVTNNSDKLTVFDAQLVVDYFEENNKVKLIVSNFKLRV